jgi:hypothetical protein
MYSIKEGQYDIASSGIDWLSLRTTNFDISNNHHALAHEVLRQAKEGGQKIEREVRQGFAGQSAQGIFMGGRESTTLLTLSGDVAREYAPIALRLGGSVSRLDLQVTVDTKLDRQNIASTSYYRAQTLKTKGGRPPRLMLTQVFKQGATLNINSRKTDQYGRLYDWGSAHEQGEQYQFWRYEIEFKRSSAKQIGKLLSSCEDLQAVTESLVHSWYEARVGSVAFSPRELLCSHKLPVSKPDRNVLHWFEQSLSVTVGRAIKDYGLARTLKALGLDKHINLERKEVT